MISLSALVSLVVYLLVGAAILGLLWWLIGFCERSIGGPPLVYAVIRVVFVVLVVLLLISLLLHLAGAPPLFRV